MSDLLNQYQKTISIRLKTRDMYNLNRIKFFWEKEDNQEYTYSEIIKICLDIICQAEDEIIKESNKMDS